MKIKRILASLLVLAQMLGMSAVMAEETPLPAEATEETVVTEEAVPENEIRIYVATDGNDGNDGSFEKPVATVRRAIAIAQAKKPSSGGKTLAVTIRGGDYYLTAGIEIPTALSGTASNPFVIQNYNGEEVNIKGSTVLEPRNFKIIKDTTVLAKLPAETRKYVGVYELPKNLADAAKYTSFTDMGTNSTGNAIFLVDGQEQTLARWPNTGFDRTATVSNGELSFTGTEGKSRSKNWENATDMIACGYFDAEYSFTSVGVASVASGVITLKSKPYYGIVTNKRYYVQNLIEELDSPGEYYIDTNEAKLYYYPKYNIASSELEIATLTDPVFSGSNLQNVTIKGIGISNTRGHAISIPSAKNVTIDSCALTNIGWQGIVAENGTNVTIKNNSISHIGSSAITISGGDMTTLTESGNLIDNNHIYDFATTARTNNPGINLSAGVGTKITNNLFHSSPSQGIWFYGNEHKILYNEFYDLVNEPTDAGAIYTGRQGHMRGNEIAYNYFHDIDTTADKGGSIYVAGVYLDDLFSSVNVHHNVFYKCYLGVMIGGGRDNNFDNNIMLECDNAMFMDARGVGWAAKHALPPAGSGTGQVYNSVLNSPHDKEPWLSRYPELHAVAENIETLGLPAGNTIRGNVIEGYKANVIANEWYVHSTVENNFIDLALNKDSYQDYDGRNFALKQGSELAKKYPEAASIDMSKIGLRSDMAEKEAAKAQAVQYRLLMPLNGTADISNLGHTFTWESHVNASKYIVKVAEDPEMNNVIIDEETKYNSANIRFIPSGGKAYWWTVTAVNESQSMKGEYTQLGAPKLIISVKEEQIDKTELRNNLKTLTTLYNAIVEGTTAGTYKEGFKDKVNNLKLQMEAEVSSMTSLQKNINALNEQYEELLDSIKDNLNYDVVNVGDLLKDKGNWVYANSEGSYEDYYTWNDDGSLTLTGKEGRKNHYVNMIYDKPLGEGVAIKFGYNVTVSSNYCIVGLQNDATFLKGGYDIIIKQNQIEIQRYCGANDGIKSTALNFYTSDGKWVDLELGALKTGIGTYVYLIADGVMVDSFLDMDTPAWTGDSKFIFGNPSGTAADCFASIRAAQD